MEQVESSSEQQDAGKPKVEMPWAAAVRSHSLADAISRDLAILFDGKLPDHFQLTYTRIGSEMYGCPIPEGDGWLSPQEKEKAIKAGSFWEIEYDGDEEEDFEFAYASSLVHILSWAGLRMQSGREKGRR